MCFRFFLLGSSLDLWTIWVLDFLSPSWLKLRFLNYAIWNNLIVWCWFTCCFADSICIFIFYVDLIYRRTLPDRKYNRIGRCVDYISKYHVRFPRYKRNGAMAADIGLFSMSFRCSFSMSFFILYIDVWTKVFNISVQKNFQKQPSFPIAVFAKNFLWCD